jgi:hypothetical protein
MAKRTTVNPAGYDWLRPRKPEVSAPGLGLASRGQAYNISATQLQPNPTTIFTCSRWEVILFRIFS